jgi:uncharacterized iron-regulated membrane protein
MDAQDQEKVWSDTVLRPEAAVVPEHPVRRPAARMHLGVIIALALAGLVLVWIVGVTFVQWRAQAAAQETLRMTQEAQRQAEAQIDQMQREALARQAQLEAEQQRQQEKRIQAFTAQQRAADAARRAEADAADRREKAWARFYRPPPHCETAATMDCTNRYIRARRQFDEKFAKGEL